LSHSRDEALIKSYTAGSILSAKIWCIVKVSVAYHTPQSGGVNLDLYASVLDVTIFVAEAPKRDH
jgi:hypothetical protein